MQIVGTCNIAVKNEDYAKFEKYVHRKEIVIPLILRKVILGSINR